MTVQRFVGATARDALRKVKEQLGPDAVVVSNKPVAEGVEILAMSPDSLDALSRGAGDGTAPSKSPTKPTAPAPAESDDDYTVMLRDARRQAAQRIIAAQSGQSGTPQARPWPAAAPSESTRPVTPRPPLEKARAPSTPLRAHDDGQVLNKDQVAATLRAAAHEAEAPVESPQVTQLMDEMRTIKALLERQLAGFAWGELAKDSPLKALLLGEMLEAGFSSALARRLIQEMPDLPVQDEARKWLRAAVNRRLRTLPADADFIDRGGVFALVGPTGVGKTTTTAKLAARCVVRYGADRLALLTTDSYRIGAHEQLRIYGRILGVPVYVVRDGEDLRRTLADLRQKHMVLIDTVGMSQRDRMVAEQAALLARNGTVNRLLVLNAGARGDTLDDVVRAYSGEDLAGCILTKVDESPSLAPGLDCVIRHGLTLAYVANGQRVPEDLHLPNRTYLLHRAFKLGAGETAHSLRADEVGLTMAADGLRAPPRPNQATGLSLG